jgi:hypothetical protein
MQTGVGGWNWSEITDAGDNNMILVDQDASYQSRFSGSEPANDSIAHVNGASNLTTVIQSVNTAGGGHADTNSSFVNVAGSGITTSITQSPGP